MTVAGKLQQQEWAAESRAENRALIVAGTVRLEVVAEGNLQGHHQEAEHIHRLYILELQLVAHIPSLGRNSEDLRKMEEAVLHSWVYILECLVVVERRIVEHIRAS